MLESLVRPEVSVWLWPVVAAGAAVAVIKLISNAFFGQRSSPPRFDLKHQSKILPGPERIHAAIYGIPKGKDYLETSDDSVRTVYDAFQHGKRSTEDGECIGWRPGPDKPYSWLSYDEVYFDFYEKLCLKFWFFRSMIKHENLAKVLSV